MPPKTISKSLPCTLTPTELGAKQDALALEVAAQQDLEVKESEAAEARKQVGASIKACVGRQRMLSKEITTRQETRVVQCVVIYDFEGGRVGHRRVDLGEYVELRLMLPGERQMALGIAEEEASEEVRAAMDEFERQMAGDETAAEGAEQEAVGGEITEDLFDLGEGKDVADPAEDTAPDSEPPVEATDPEDTGEALSPPAEDEPAAPDEPMEEDELPPAAHVPSPTALLAALQTVQPGRRWTTGAVLTIAVEERAAVAEWCLESTPPVGNDEGHAAIQHTILEDLDHEVSQDDLRALLGMVGFISLEDVADDAWSDVAAWAEAAHRRDRGEQVEVPSLPESLVPSNEDLKLVLDFVMESGGEATRETVVDNFIGAIPGASLICQALEVEKLLSWVEDPGVYSADVGTLTTRVPMILANLAQRKPALEGLDDAAE